MLTIDTRTRLLVYNRKVPFFDETRRVFSHFSSYSCSVSKPQLVNRTFTAFFQQCMWSYVHGAYVYNGEAVDTAITGVSLVDNFSRWTLTAESLLAKPRGSGPVSSSTASIRGITAGSLSRGSAANTNTYAVRVYCTLPTGQRQ
jgi:hypothetical protein